MKPGDVLGERYRLEEEIGDRGVYRATDLVRDTTVAVKVFRRERASEEAFRRETAIAMQAHHPNLVSLIDAGVAPDGYWLVSDYVPGLEVRTRLVDFGPMGVRKALDVGCQIFAALDAMHRRGLFHGDLKPDNVLLEGGRVRVFDYEMGRMAWVIGAGSGVYPGTAEYMHPNLFRNAVPDVGTDCFAAWVTLYELLAGRRPYTIGQLKGGLPLPAPAPVGDSELDTVLRAGLAGLIGDARAAWLTLVRFVRGRGAGAIPRPTVAQAVEEGALIQVMDAVRDQMSVAVVGPREVGLLVLRAAQRSWVAEGGNVLWIRADAGSLAEPMSGALSLASSAVDLLDPRAFARVLEGLGAAREVFSAMLPSARAWFGPPTSPGRRPVEALVPALTRLLEACPRPLVILVDGLDRLDNASRRWVSFVVTSGAAVVLGSAGGSRAHGMPIEVHLGHRQDAPGDEEALAPEHLEVLQRARTLGLPFGARLARAMGRTEEEVAAAAIEAEAHGCATWDGAEVSPREGRPVPANTARGWCREAAARLDPVLEPLLVARFALLGRDRERLATVLPAAVEEVSHVEPALALELLDSGPAERTPLRQLRHLRIALLARDLVAARRVVAGIEANPASSAVDRAEARGSLALESGAVIEAIEALRRAAASLGQPVRTGFPGRVEDTLAGLRLRFGRRLPPRRDERLARVLAHLYDLHYGWDAAPLERLQALWEQAEPGGIRPRGVRLVLLSARGDWRQAEPLERELRAELDTIGGTADSGVLLYHLGLTRLLRGDTRGALAEGVVSAERLASGGHAYLAALAHSLVWLAGYHLGASAMVERLTVEVEAITDATGDRRALGWLSGARTSSAWLRGDIERAAELAEAWATDARSRSDSNLALALRCRGELLLELGAVEAAADVFRECGRVARYYRQSFDWIEARIVGVAIADARLRLAGRRGAAARVASRLRALARSPRWVPRIQAAEAWIALADGRRADAVRHFVAGEERAVELDQLNDLRFVLRERARALGDEEAERRAAALVGRRGLRRGDSG